MIMAILSLAGPPFRNSERQTSVRAGLELFEGFRGRNATIRKSGWVAKNGKWLSGNDFGGELATGRVVRSELA